MRVSIWSYSGLCWIQLVKLTWLWLGSAAQWSQISLILNGSFESNINADSWNWFYACQVNIDNVLMNSLAAVTAKNQVPLGPTSTLLVIATAALCWRGRQD